MTSSIAESLEVLRQYLAEALDMERLDPRRGVDMAPDPTYGGSYVAVRWGSLQVVEGRGETTTSEPYLKAGVMTVTETLEPPRARLRVFIDVHDGQDETGHLEHVADLMRLHPPASRVEIAPGVELLVETVEPSTQGDVYNTVTTAWLYFDLTEQSSSVEGPTLRQVTVQTRQNPALEGPTAEEFVIGEP